MKKVCTYLLVFTLLFENSILSELFKMPFLIEHFVEHQQQNPAISIARFLDMHYMGHDQSDNDASKDMKLPFKKVDTHSHQVLFQSNIRMYSLYKDTYIQSTEAIYSDTLIQDPGHGRLYRPPQMA